MTRQGNDELAKWLAAERADSWDEADAGFAAVASSHFQRLVEPAGFSARLMAALPRGAAVGWFRAVPDAANWRWVRAVVAAAVVVLGITLAATSFADLLAFSTRSVEALARIALGVSTSVSAALGVAVASWTVLMDLGRAAMVLATSGPAPALILANILLASLAFAGLSRLLPAREEYL